MDITIFFILRNIKNKLILTVIDPKCNIGSWLIYYGPVGLTYARTYISIAFEPFLHAAALILVFITQVCYRD